MVGMGGQALLSLLGCTDVEAAQWKLAGMDRAQLQASEGVEVYKLPG